MEYNPIKGALLWNLEDALYECRDLLHRIARVLRDANLNDLAIEVEKIAEKLEEKIRKASGDEA